MEAINISLQEGYAEIQYSEAGIRKNKIIDIDDLHSIFKDNIDYDSGDLGVWGENAMAIKRIMSRGDKHCVLVEAVNPLVTTQLGRKTYKNVPYPSIVMGVFLQKGPTGRFTVNKEKTFILTHQNMIVTPNDQLFKFPFSNVWGDSNMGKICWGSIAVPGLESFAQAIGVLQIFLQGTMNYDLLNLGSLSASGDVRKILTSRNSDDETTLGKIFDHLITLGTFPYSEFGLVRKTKYNDLIKYCKQNL